MKQTLIIFPLLSGVLGVKLLMFVELASGDTGPVEVLPLQRGQQLKK